MLSYEIGRLAEPAVRDAGDPTDMPLGVFWRYDVDAEHLPPAAGSLPRARARVSPEDPRYLRHVSTCRERIGAGDLYQANLSRRIELDFAEEPDGLALARTLQHRERHSYAAWARVAEGTEIVSLSPECLLRGRLGGAHVASFPIKGTTRPGADAVLADPKERAEHVMIVDLVRNDLGRVGDVGGVWVDPLLGVRDMRTLRHLESAVRARLAPGRDVLDALVALLPAGSITGAPKIAATRLIAELEGRPRGAYTGSLVTIDAAGHVVVSLLIRTLVLSGRRGRLDVGGGIVWASDPEQERQETRRKARAHLDGVVASIP